MLRSLQGRLSAALVAGLVVLACAAAAIDPRAAPGSRSYVGQRVAGSRAAPAALALTDIMRREADDDEDDSSRVTAVRPHDVADLRSATTRAVCCCSRMTPISVSFRPA
jgi:two-component system OmpR family sensor kinase